MPSSHIHDTDRTKPHWRSRFGLLARLLARSAVQGERLIVLSRMTSNNVEWMGPVGANGIVRNNQAAQQG